MSVYRTSLLAFASLLPIALALPAAATTNKIDRFIGSTISVEGCHWYNFHQSISLWPVYMDCKDKNGQKQYKTYWRKYFHETHQKGYSKNAILLMNESDTSNHSSVYKPGHIQLEINQHYKREACAWFNYIQSRHRTPLYMPCNGKHKASYGMYSANDYLKETFAGATKSARIKAEKEWEAKQRGPAPDVVAALKKNQNVVKEINGKHYKMSACQWSNFFQSLSFLPRYINCTTGIRDPHLKHYEGFKNLHKISFGFVGGTSHTGNDFYNKKITLYVGNTQVEATACVWYNLVQTEVRWPMYRKCPSQAKVVNSPAPDLMVIHDLPYTN